MTTGPSEHRPRNSTTRVEIFANDALSAIGFYTRLPAWRLVPAERPGDSAGSQWAAPLAGILIGLLLGLLNGAIDALDLPELSRGLLVVGAGILLTGALHEDGFADLADGFGGGTDRQRKLAIMKDSRLGSYGALALVVSVILRASLVAVLTEPAEAALALVAAHAASRALMPAMLHHLPNARGDGVAFSVGRPASRIVAIALAIGLLALLPLGPLMLLFSLVALAAVYAAVAALALRQIGGQTGDVCGTLQQIAEIAVLAVCATMLT